mgnify:CR=1 FL=1
MKPLALLLLLGAATGLGLFLGWRQWHRQRNNPVHGAVHFIVGMAGLECMLLLMRSGSPATGADRLAQPAALLLGLALLAGFAAPVAARQWGQRPGRLLLWLHALLALTGVVLALAWLAFAGA